MKHPSAVNPILKFLRKVSQAIKTARKNRAERARVRKRFPGISEADVTKRLEFEAQCDRRGQAMIEHLKNHLRKREQEEKAARFKKRFDEAIREGRVRTDRVKLPEATLARSKRDR